MTNRQSLLPLLLALLGLLALPSLGASRRLDTAHFSIKNVFRKFACAASAFTFTLSSTGGIDGTASFADVSTTQPQQVYGLKKGRLLPCKTKSNCISTSSVNSVSKYSRPWEFSKSAEEEYEDVIKAIKSAQYLKIVDQNQEKLYIRAEAKSAFPPTGTDDVEFLLNPVDKIIAYRSNSRDLVAAGTEIVGDAGSNRNRLDAIKLKLGVQEMGMNTDVESYLKNVDSLSFIQKINEASKPNEINFVDNSVPDDPNTSADKDKASTAIAGDDAQKK